PQSPGARLVVRASVALGELSPDDVTMQVVYGTAGEEDEIIDPAFTDLTLDPDGGGLPAGGSAAGASPPAGPPGGSGGGGPRARPEGGSGGVAPPGRHRRALRRRGQAGPSGTIRLYGPGPAAASIAGRPGGNGPGNGASRARRHGQRRPALTEFPS